MSEQTFTVVISDDLQVGFFAQDGTFEDGQRNLKALLALLDTEGSKVKEAGDIEQHRHTDEMNHLHDLSHAGGHSH